MLRYKLRTLLILLAVLPPVLGFAGWAGLGALVVALSAVTWCIAFACSLSEPVRSRHGLIVAEWLVVLAITVVIAALLVPAFAMSVS